MHTHPYSSPPAVSETQTQIGAGTFLISRQYVGNCSVSELLRQRIRQDAHTTSSIDGRIGTAV